MLGILIGIAAVILTVGLGEGAQAKVESAIASLGTNMLIVTPGSTTTSGVRGGLGSATTLTMADATALASPLDCPNIAAVAPVVQRPMTLVAGGANWTAPVVGTTPSYLQIRNRQLDLGRGLSQHDVAAARHVVVLGSLVAQNLFGSTNPLAQTVTINGIPFQVIGVLTSAGSSAAANEDNLAIVPITTAQMQLIGGSNPTSVSQILLEASTPSTLGAAYDEANDLLLQLHHIATPAQADFTITAQTTIETAATSTSRTLTILLAGIAAISLLVGGIGVMNIMLVSVTERIREIGLRKALGATPSVIRRQFLAEAMMLGLGGGLIGIIVGLVGSVVLPRLVQVPVVISWPATGAALLVAIGVGLVFGVYPASRASRLAPIDALRAD